MMHVTGSHRTHHTHKKTHTLQKPPEEESSGLDLKDLRFQEVAQTAGDFNKNGWPSRQAYKLLATRLPPADVAERAKALETNSIAAPPTPVAQALAPMASCSKCLLCH